MARKIKDIVISNISLLTGENEPAVPKAETRYAVLKMNYDKKLEKIKKELDDIANNLE